MKANSDNVLEIVCDGMRLSLRLDEPIDIKIAVLALKKVMRHKSIAELEEVMALAQDIGLDDPDSKPEDKENNSPQA